MKYMKVKKEEIKQWINDVYTKLWALLSLYGETDGFNTVPEGEVEEDPREFISRKIREIRRIEQNFSLYMDEKEIEEVKKLEPKLMAIDPEVVFRSIDPKVGEISYKLDKIINDTVYFYNQHVILHDVPGKVPSEIYSVVFWWSAINPHLIYFDRVFDLMERYPETYMGRLHYPVPELIAERNAYFEKIKERNERENLNWSKERFFQEELLNTLKLLFESEFKEYL